MSDMIREHRVQTGSDVAYISERPAQVNIAGIVHNAGIYTVRYTNPKLRREMMEDVLVLTSDEGDIAWIYVPDVAELCYPVPPRPPYAILAEGKRWVPAFVQDSVNIWTVTGGERDYDNEHAIRFLELFWIGAVRDKPLPVPQVEHQMNEVTIRVPGPETPKIEAWVRD